MFGKLFGAGKRDGGSTASASHAVDAIQKLAETMELMEKRKEVLEKKIAAELEKAKEFMQKKNRSSAALALKRKALIEKQLEGVDNNIMRMQEQLGNLESSQATFQTVTAMQQAARASKTTMAKLNVENVDKVMEEIQETADQAAEIQQALAVPLGGAAEIDDDDIEAQLADMESAALDEELLAPAALPDKGEALPSVPTTKPRVKTTEDELAELAAELAA